MSFYTVRSLSFDDQYVNIRWNPSWYHSSEIPVNFDQKRILCSNKSEVLITWPSEKLKVDKALKTYASSFTMEQRDAILSHIEEQRQRPWLTSQKQDINLLFANLVKQCKIPGKCVYLDAELAKTTKALCKVTDKELVVVNFDRHVIDSILSTTKHCRNKPNVYLGSMFSYLTRVSDKSISCIWLDYCYTFYNKKHSPKRDIRLLSQALCSGSIAAFTFSLRAGKRSRKCQIQEIIGFVVKTLNGHCTHKVLYGNMIFLLFKVQ